MFHPIEDFHKYIHPGKRVHLAGIGGAQTIVAVNEEPDAPIFGAARYKVVGDCIEVAGELLDRLESR